jgi:hypothetical protein
MKFLPVISLTVAISALMAASLSYSVWRPSAVVVWPDCCASGAGVCAFAPSATKAPIKAGTRSRRIVVGSLFAVLFIAVRP